ncbi:precorrin-2 dehydrogenase/sirohydrochlorin ferrochelatase family protein, partial [Gluconacetobacter johannae]
MTAPADPGWFPLALRLHDARVLVVGGGGIALNKVRLLLAHGARIEIVATHLDDRLEQWRAEGRIALAGTDAAPDLLRALLPGCRLVYAATDDRDLNRAVAALARGMNIPVCAVDDPAPSTFITPAQIHRGPVRIAISTGGAAPVLARRLRERIEAAIPAGLDGLARFLEAERTRVVARCPDIARRRRVWEDFLDGPGATAAGAGDTATARQVLDRLLDGGKTGGEVWLVGAGPGDPDLLTLRALHLMQNADSV